MAKLAVLDILVVMQIQKNIALGQFTSLGCGGAAETLALVENTNDLTTALEEFSDQDVTVLGFGTNSLISDEGIPGVTILTHGGDISEEDGVLIADSGVWWDDLVLYALDRRLWGLELMSGIPSSVGGAVMGNIAAYGQQVSDTLVWVDVYNLSTKETSRISADEIDFSYRRSSLQNQPEIVILRAAFRLSESASTPLTYASATSIAEEIGLSSEVLEERRQIIMEARRRAGSLYDPADSSAQHTAGSFFKNPMVNEAQAEEIAKHDETGKSLELLLAQNKIHGGDTKRVSAAHVLLAAGFSRGQAWGNVRLHPEHILKIENTGGATAQEIYKVAQLIINQVQEKLGITLEPEVKFIGEFKKEVA